VKRFLLLIAALSLLAAGARAQVIINHAALDQLAGIAAAPPPAPATVEVPRRWHRLVSHPPRRLVSARPAGLPAAEKPVPPTIKPSPAPQPAVVKPAPPPVPLIALIHFTSKASGLPGPASAALKPFCGYSGGLVTINAYAEADPSDPSLAARLSLDRAFAIRDALIACGLPSARIIPKANGAAKTADPNAALISVTP
jgi:hypothetical protein